MACSLVSIYEEDGGERGLLAAKAIAPGQLLAAVPTMPLSLNVVPIAAKCHLPSDFLWGKGA